MTGSYVGGGDSAGCSTSITEKQRERHRSNFWTVRRRVPGPRRKHLNLARDRIFLLEDARPVLIPAAPSDGVRNRNGQKISPRRSGRNGAQNPSAVRDRLQAPDGQSD